MATDKTWIYAEFLELLRRKAQLNQAVSDLCEQNSNLTGDQIKYHFHQQLVEINRQVVDFLNAPIFNSIKAGAR